MRKPLYVLVLAIVASGLTVAQRADLSGIKICIDPGHGGYFAATDRHVIPDAGTDFWESESNFQKALLLKSLLEAKGATALLTRNTNDYPTDNEPSLAARVALANANNVNWFHSIHSNASGAALNTTANYTLMLIREKVVQGGSSVYGPGTGNPETQEAWNISSIIGPNIKSGLRTQRVTQFLDWTFYGGNNGGYTLGVLRGLQMPGELSEGSFHDYYPETRRLMNNRYRKMEAYALRDAFLSYFQVPPDTLCIVAGILKHSSGTPINGVKVRLLPEDIVYTGDNYNNGFYMFDGVKAGAHTLSFETPNYETASVAVTLEAGKTLFLDRSFVGGAPATLTYYGPTTRDTLYSVNQTIGLSFSAAMDTASFRQAFSITPTVSGTLIWYNSLTTVLFRPDQQFQYLTWYTYRVAATARTTGGGYLDGNGDGTAGDDFVIKFRTMPPPVFVEQESAIPTFGLAQNFPNPFNPTTAISFQLSDVSQVALKVFDVLGREVASLVEGQKGAGSYTVQWNASGLPSGIYLYRLQTRDQVATRKMILTK
jgi:N-acetylmuramoyl-L-alanine amidase